MVREISEESNFFHKRNIFLQLEIYDLMYESSSRKIS